MRGRTGIAGAALFNESKVAGLIKGPTGASQFCNVMPA